MFRPIPKEQVPREWPRISAMLDKAIAHDDNATPRDVYAWLTSGLSEAFWINSPAATGIAVTTIAPIGGVKVCWLNYVAGTVKGGPRAFIAAVRAIVAQIEVLARKQGCAELRGGGRDWLSRVLPDWERFDPNHPNRMRKVI